MRFLFFIITLSILNIECLGSCLIMVEHNDKNYLVSIWKHEEGKEDIVIHKFYNHEELKPIALLVNKKKGMKAIFNDGVFTSMNYMEGSTLRWANMNHGEKDVISFIQEKFDVTETRH